MSGNKQTNKNEVCANKLGKTVVNYFVRQHHFKMLRRPRLRSLVGLVLFTIQRKWPSILQVGIISPASSSPTHPTDSGGEEEEVASINGRQQELCRRGLFTMRVHAAFSQGFFDLNAGRQTQLQRDFGSTCRGRAHLPSGRFQKAFRRAANQTRSWPRLQNYQLLAAEQLTC